MGVALVSPARGDVGGLSCEGLKVDNLGCLIHHPFKCDAASDRTATAQ